MRNSVGATVIAIVFLVLVSGLCLGEGARGAESAGRIDLALKHA